MNKQAVDLSTNPSFKILKLLSSKVLQPIDILLTPVPNMISISLSLISSSTYNNKAKWQAFEWRINSATRLAEASPVNVARFLGTNNKTNPYISGIKIIFSVVAEIYWKTLSFIFLKFLRYILK